jgi:hypothetical protein
MGLLYANCDAGEETLEAEDRKRKRGERSPFRRRLTPQTATSPLSELPPTQTRPETETLGEQTETLTGGRPLLLRPEGTLTLLERRTEGGDHYPACG